MKENKSELVFMKKENILDLINLNESSSEYFSNIMNFQYNHKLLLEKMLKIIKNIQVEILSEKSFIKTNNKLSSKIIINILKDLKIELNSIFKDKKQKYTRIKYRPKKICIHSLIQTFTKDSKNILINPRLGPELFKLKLSNFKVENQIACIDDKIKLISYSILNANNNYQFLYIFFNESNEESPASKILHDNLLCARDIFKTVVKKKAFQNNVINQLNTAITILKEENQLNKKKYKNEYIITSQIINEETKEYPTKISSFANEQTTEKGKIKMNEIESNVLYKDKLIYI